MEQDPVLEERLKALGTAPIDRGLESAHMTRMAGAVRSSRRRAKLRVGGAVVAACFVATSGLAAAGALPDPAQHLAHRAFDSVGVGVPDPGRYHGPECGPDVKQNHGAYVRDDHDLATSQCGKKIHTGQDGTSAEDEDQSSSTADDGPCQGPPPWAGHDAGSMSPEAKAKAQAERAAECGDEADSDDATDAPEATEREAPTSTTAPSTTTTTVGTTTTTTEPATTETTATTGA
jgi:hypothetical protein